MREGERRREKMRERRTDETRGERRPSPKIKGDRRRHRKRKEVIVNEMRGKETICETYQKKKARGDKSIREVPKEYGRRREETRKKEGDG
jgi:hypothetical protein